MLLIICFLSQQCRSEGEQKAWASGNPIPVIPDAHAIVLRRKRENHRYSVKSGGKRWLPPPKSDHPTEPRQPEFSRRGIRFRIPNADSRTVFQSFLCTRRKCGTMIVRAVPPPLLSLRSIFRRRMFRRMIINLYAIALGLLFVHWTVLSLQTDQFFMSAAFGYLAFAQAVYPVCI